MEFTPGWNINTGLWNDHNFLLPERLSVAYCSHIIQTTLILKIEDNHKKTMFTATGGPKDVPCVLCRCCGVVTNNTQPSIYSKCLGYPRIAGIIHSSHIIALDLFCSQCRRCSYLRGIRFLHLCPVKHCSLNKADGFRSWTMAGKKSNLRSKSSAKF
jgi:hypothetical protein